jgi:hypothetical protein
MPFADQRRLSGADQPLSNCPFAQLSSAESTRNKFKLIRFILEGGMRKEEEKKERSDVLEISLHGARNTNKLKPFHLDLQCQLSLSPPKALGSPLFDLQRPQPPRQWHLSYLGQVNNAIHVAKKSVNEAEMRISTYLASSRLHLA